MTQRAWLLLVVLGACSSKKGEEPEPPPVEPKIIEASGLGLREARDEIEGTRFTIKLPDLPACSPEEPRARRPPCLSRFTKMRESISWTYSGRGQAHPNIVIQRGREKTRGQERMDMLARHGRGSPVTKRVMPDDGALAIWEAQDGHEYNVTRTTPIDAEYELECRAEQSTATRHPLPDFKAAVAWATRICESLTIVR